MREESGNAKQRGLFIEIDEGDPFEALKLVAKLDSGEGIIAGEMDVEPGRYQLRRVDDE